MENRQTPVRLTIISDLDI